MAHMQEYPPVDRSRESPYAQKIIKNSRRDANMKRDKAKPHRHRDR